jgi:hypothetical protein
MDPADLIGTGQIGHGPGHAQDTGIAARGQAHRLGGLEQQLLARRVGRGVAVEQVAVEFGIVAPPGAFEPVVWRWRAAATRAATSSEPSAGGGRARSAAETGSTST